MAVLLRSWKHASELDKRLCPAIAYIDGSLFNNASAESVIDPN